MFIRSAHVLEQATGFLGLPHLLRAVYGTECECRDVRNDGGDRGSSRRRLNIGQPALLTQCMVRPCVARSFVDLVFGLASMYPASDWSVFCSGPPWISARGRSHYRLGLDWAIRVTSVRSRREDRSPSRRYLSQTSAGKGLSASLLRHR